MSDERLPRVAPIDPSVLGKIAKNHPSELTRVIACVDRLKKNPGLPSLQLKPLKDEKNLWSARVSDGFRALLTRHERYLHLVDVRPRGKAYRNMPAAANGPQVDPSPPPTSMSVESAGTPRTSASRPSPHGTRLFDGHGDAYLVSLGVADSQLAFVREFRDKEDIEDAWVKGAFQDEVAECLQELADGGLPSPPVTDPVDEACDSPGDPGPPVYVIEDERLKRCLEAPWEKWVTFLSDEQRAIVAKDFNGPAKVTGTAGTGKTLVALHRARRLAEHGHRVLLATYGKTLADNLDRSLQFVTDKPGVRHRIRTSTVDGLALKMVGDAGGSAKPVDKKEAHPILRKELRSLLTGTRFGPAFIVAEWDEVIQLQGITTLEQYRDAYRHGRVQQLRQQDREALWPIFERTRAHLAEHNQMTWHDLRLRAAELLKEGTLTSPFDAVIVDEVQDLSVPGLRFLWQLARHRPENFMVVGDAGQRIYPGGYSLRRLGIEVSGRSRRLKINFRTTREIRRFADALGHSEADDMDSGSEKRDDTQDAVGGRHPKIRRFDTRSDEHQRLVAQIKEWIGPEFGYEPADIAVFVRTKKLVSEIDTALDRAAIEVLQLRRDTNLNRPGVRVGTMHRSKGLEFKAVWVGGVEKGLLPASWEMDKATDQNARDEVEARERSLLYVAMTRARHQLVVSWSGSPSELLSAVSQPAVSRSGAPDPARAHGP